MWRLKAKSLGKGRQKNPPPSCKESVNVQPLDKNVQSGVCDSWAIFHALHYETVFLTASAACSLAFLLFRHFCGKSIELGRLAKRCWALLKSFSGVCLKGRFPANAISLNWMQRDSAVLVWYDMQIKLSSPKLLAFLAVLPGAWQVGGHCQRFQFSFFHFFWCKQHVKLGCRASQRVGRGELDDIRSSGIVQAWSGFESNLYQQTRLDMESSTAAFL